MENGYGHGGRSSSSFSAGRIIGDPFALATISIGMVCVLVIWDLYLRMGG
jgi:hypothetical protein